MDINNFSIESDKSKFNFQELEKKNVSEDISSFFTKTQLSNMCEYEKKRYRNMKKNYEMMLALGLPAIKPDFMQGPRAKIKKIKLEYSDSDEEWTPATERKAASTSRDLKPAVPLKTKMTSKMTKKTVNSEDAKATTSAADTGSHSYPLRDRIPTNYMNLEGADDDEYLYCEECNKEYEGDCLIHGPLIVVEDNKVLGGKVADRALHTLPNGLQIKASSIPDAGLGVWTQNGISARTRFGPYEGNLIWDLEKAHATGYSWQVYKNNKPSHFVDAFETSVANWMRYVNCARSESEQNLSAFQHKGQIYYRAYKPIPPNTELLVWYGQDYAGELGIQREPSWKDPIFVNGSKMYRCPSCRRCFADVSYLLGHNRNRHGINLLIPCRRHEKADMDVYKYNKMGNEHYESNVFCSNAKSKYKGISKIHKSHRGHKISKSCFLFKNLKEKRQCVQIKYKNIFHDDQLCSTSHNIEMNESIKNKMFKCSEYDATYTKSESLQQHLNVHSEDTKFKSEGLLRTIKLTKCQNDEQILNITRVQDFYKITHDKIELVNEYKSYTCNACSEVFRDSSCLQNHIKTCPEKKPNKCDVRSGAFSRSGNVQRHLRTHTGDKPYTCNLCGKAFCQSSDLQKHLRTHTGDKPYTCNVCGKAFSQSGTLHTHLKAHAGDKPYKCDVCGKAFNKSCNLETHLGTHTGDKPYKCDVCGKAFNKSCNLETHLRTHTGDKPYKCDVCGKAFSQSSHLETHLRTHTGDKPYKCDVCGKAFNHSGTLQRHLRTHTGNKPYKCDVCGKAFSESGTLQTHLRTHTGDKPYKCDLCGRSFNKSCNLQTHLRTHTGDKPYKCDVCGKAFSQSSTLQTHLRTHTEDKPYKCDVCGKAFNQSSDLQRHIRTHTGDKPYKCDVCGKAFSQSSDLQRHIRTHTGDKPYKCDVCGKAFSQSSTLQTHLRTHTGDKTYKCDVCGKAFNHSGTLQRHLRTHTGNKPYKCDVCGKAFSVSSNLQKHLRTHTGDKPYKCDVCGKAFSESGTLQTHLGTHAGDKPYKI